MNEILIRQISLLDSKMEYILGKKVQFESIISAIKKPQSNISPIYMNQHIPPKSPHVRTNFNNNIYQYPVVGSLERLRAQYSRAREY